MATQQQLVDAISALRPGAQWSMTGSDLSGLQWLDSVQTAPTAAQINGQILLSYAVAKQKVIAAGGISVNVGTTTVPVNVEAATDQLSLVLLHGAYTMGQANANANASFKWVQSNGVAVTLTAAQVTTIFNAVTAFVQNTFTTLAAVLAAIAAGTVTSTAQVDSFASPAWPVNS